MNYTDVMLDIETVGRTPGCAIINITAVPFNIQTGDISNNIFSMDINLDKQLLKGFNQDQNTIKWWKGNNKNLFHKLINSDNHYVEVGKEFQKWYRSLKNSSTLKLWANSPRFDISILMGWYAKSIKSDFQPFWNTWNERDVRTIAALDPNVKKFTIFKGTKHNAVDDCKHQINYCHKIVRKYKLRNI